MGKVIVRGIQGSNYKELIMDGDSSMGQAMIHAVKTQNKYDAPACGEFDNVLVIIGEKSGYLNDKSVEFYIQNLQNAPWADEVDVTAIKVENSVNVSTQLIIAVVVSDTLTISLASNQVSSIYDKGRGGSIDYRRVTKILEETDGSVLLYTSDGSLVGKVREYQVLVYGPIK